MTYLDGNASEPLRPAARAALLAALEITGNPASVHAAGRVARATLEAARERLAARFGCDPAGVVLTSGGTESIAFAIHMLAEGRCVLTGATEHDAVRAAHARETLPVDADGVLDLPALDAALAAGGPALVCVMAANNETGVIQPTLAIAELCHRRGALLFCDAVQAAGRVGFDLAASGADAAAVSSHKLGGPQGAGAALLAPRMAERVRPLIAGGGQERGRRGGTPAVATLAGFAAAADADRLSPELLRGAVEAAAVACGAQVNGAGAERLPNTASIWLPGVLAATQVMALDLAGVAVSAGAACSSGKVAASHVLIAMGLRHAATESIRVSLPWNATEADVAAFAAAYQTMATRVSRRAA